MPFPNLFTKEESELIIKRIDSLGNSSPASWGKLDTSQMFSHCNVTYEMIYTDKHPKPNFLMSIMIKRFIQSKVVSETPYTKNGPTVPAFVITDKKEFDAEKNPLIEHIRKNQELRAQYFDGEELHSLGPLNTLEWNNMMNKHLDHHLKQFRV
ncbi:MAG: hypothetical protein ACI9O4_001688 [Chitinophagales bacterium]|jgi:hypothetical protein